MQRIVRSRGRAAQNYLGIEKGIRPRLKVHCCSVSQLTWRLRAKEPEVSASVVVDLLLHGLCYMRSTIHLPRPQVLLRRLQMNRWPRGDPRRCIQLSA